MPLPVLPSPTSLRYIARVLKIGLLLCTSPRRSGNSCRNPSDDEIDADAYFAATFECAWDSEHGLSILFNDRGELVDVGDNHFS